MADLADQIRPPRPAPSPKQQVRAERRRPSVGLTLLQPVYTGPQITEEQVGRVAGGPYPGPRVDTG